MTKRWLKAGLGLLVATLGAACAGPRLPTTAAGATLLTVRGQTKDGPFFLGRADLAKLPRGTFKALPPGATAEVTFGGVDLKKLLEFHLQLPEGVDTLVFVTSDALALPMSLGLIRQYGPLLADEADGQPVAPRLVWPNLDQRGLDADPRAGLWWAGPIEAVELLSWDRSWGRVLRSPPGVSDEARLGAGQYATRCAACHRLRGVGGLKGPALDGALKRLTVAGFVAAVQRHPGWPATVGNELTAGEVVAQQAAAFLAATELSVMPPPAEEPVRPRPAGSAPRPGP